MADIINKYMNQKKDGDPTEGIENMINSKKRQIVSKDISIKLLSFLEDLITSLFNNGILAENSTVYF